MLGNDYKSLQSPRNDILTLDSLSEQDCQGEFLFESVHQEDFERTEVTAISAVHAYIL